MAVLLGSHGELGHRLQETNVEAVLVVGAQIGQLLHEIVADALLLQQVHEKIVQVSVQDIASHSVSRIRVLSTVDGHLIDSEDVIWNVGIGTTVSERPRVMNGFISYCSRPLKIAVRAGMSR